MAKLKYLWIFVVAVVLGCAFVSCGDDDDDTVPGVSPYAPKKKLVMETWTEPSLEHEVRVRYDDYKRIRDITHTYTYNGNYSGTSEEYLRIDWNKNKITMETYRADYEFYFKLNSQGCISEFGSMSEVVSKSGGILHYDTWDDYNYRYVYENGYLKEIQGVLKDDESKKGTLCAIQHDEDGNLAQITGSRETDTYKCIRGMENVGNFIPFDCNYGFPAPWMPPFSIQEWSGGTCNFGKYLISAGLFGKISHDMVLSEEGWCNISYRYDSDDYVESYTVPYGFNNIEIRHQLTWK